MGAGLDHLFLFSKINKDLVKHSECFRGINTPPAKAF